LFDEFEGIDPGVVERLVEAALLLPPQIASLLAPGLLLRAPKPVGRSEFRLAQLTAPKRARGVGIIGAPSELGADGDVGAKFGPNEIRRYIHLEGLQLESTTTGSSASPREIHDLEFHRTVSLEQVDLIDLGNIAAATGEALTSFGQRLGYALDRLLGLGYVPIILGGDHSITHFILRSFIRRGSDLAIIHFDAHSDLFPTTVLSHGNPFSEFLASQHCRALHQIGLRQVLTSNGPPLRDPRVRYASARDVRKQTPEQIFEGLDRKVPVYVTFDIDCMDPALCPETGTPVAGGLSYYDCVDLFDWMTTNLRIVGADFVEVAKDGRRNQAARVAGALVTRLVLGFGESRPLEGHYFGAPPGPLDGP
jgi:agmatinase